MGLSVVYLGLDPVPSESSSWEFFGPKGEKGTPWNPNWVDANGVLRLPWIRLPEPNPKPKPKP